MGSIIDYIACPNCGTEAYNDFYYKTGEEYTRCNNCGYSYSATYKRDDNGDFITKDGTDDYDFNNLIMEIDEIKNPYGAFRYKVKGDIGFVCGTLREEGDLQFIEHEIAQLEKENKLEYFAISRLIDGEIVVENIFG